LTAGQFLSCFLRYREYPAPVLLAFVLLLAGVVVGVLRGGSLENINRVRFRLPWLVFLGLALQIGADAAGARFPGIRGSVVGPLVLAISYGFVGTFVVLNFRLRGAPLIGLGLLLNLSVILANGAMPVSLWAMKVSGSHAATHLQNSVKHQAMGRSTRLGFLGDIIPVPPLGIVSVGDVVLGAGVFLLVTHLMAPDKHRNSNDPNGNNRNGNNRNGNHQNGNNRNGNNRSEEGPGRHCPNAPEPPPFSGLR
jgi:hypothetical protein